MLGSFLESLWGHKVFACWHSRAPGSAVLSASSEAWRKIWNSVLEVLSSAPGIPACSSFRPEEVQGGMERVMNLFQLVKLSSALFLRSPPWR